MKKNVGIITLIGSNNYGNRLQNYATEFVVSKYGLNPITIRNYYSLNTKTSKIRCLYKLIRYYLSRIKNRILKNNSKRLKCFNSFDKNLNITKKVYTIYSVNRLKMDYYLVGSDQVWKPTYGRLSDLDLLSFTDPSKRIAISASFGISELPEKHILRAQKELKKFKAISVREEAGKNIVENITGRNDIFLMIDPTMMLTSEEWDAVSKEPIQLKTLNNKKYILNYFLGELSDEKRNVINEFARKNDLMVINILDKNDPFYETGPSEFLYLEKNATLICTDSFHSSVFAILYNTPFIVFDRQDKIDNMGSRIDTLLSKFKLENRRFNGVITENLINHDYTEAYKILEVERKKSDEFLKKALDIK